ncbi:hypothetical protein M514_00806 [Trichuris suis]|uniref:Uncharacterized protein n=1 Tax=Trichuris suis TaxID=68888 RepID=A0A085N995_9BILA|nr:hypothetical protein M513_00806 [Trichuris suis]KFD66041.1 hypothetical protein M514_00806 [Trichuris suis]
MLHLLSVDPAVSVCSLLYIVLCLTVLNLCGSMAYSFACNVFSECCILLISCTTLKTGRVLVKEGAILPLSQCGTVAAWRNG